MGTNDNGFTHKIEFKSPKKEFTIEWGRPLDYQSYDRNPMVYGYFEIVDYTYDTEYGDVSQGGLWFEQVGDQLTLTDADGTYSVPKEVITFLETCSIIVPEEFK
jgi:hypothetical protein